MRCKVQQIAQLVDRAAQLAQRQLTFQKSAGLKLGFRSEMKAPTGAEAATAPCTSVTAPATTSHVIK